MRVSQLLNPTLREVPAEAEVISHQLMVRAGLIRKSASGLYTYLPLGLRILRKIETIVREEMNAKGGQEVLMPIMQPAELWKLKLENLQIGRLLLFLLELILVMKKEISCIKMRRWKGFLAPAP